MTFFLFFIFAVIILGVMLLLSIIKGIGSLLFGRSSSFSGSSSGSHNASGNGSNDNMEDGYAKKVFSKDEGEYVKYEEIKD